MSEAEILRSLDDKMKKALHNVKAEFGKIRGSRASLTLLEGIRADYYGNPTPLSQMATLSTPDPRTITISPWDKSAIAAIEKAIQTSDLGVAPTNDGNVVRLNMPALTEERRRDLVKVVKKIAEEARVALRHVRRDANEAIKAALKAKTLSEDDEKRLLKKVQDLTDDYTRQVDQAANNKEKDILEV
jgi:ribosome recycling factor